MAHRACPYRCRPDLGGSEIRALRKRQVDGFLYVRMYNQEVIMPSALQGLPTVLVDGTCSDPLIPSIVPDEFSELHRDTRADSIWPHRNRFH